jgi:limonene-1,2-epoxide hydrolase
MNHTERFRHFLDAYARKDLAAITPMLADDVTLRDWNISVHGRQAVEAATLQNFQNAETIEIQVLAVCANDSTVAGELRIVVDRTVELFVVDVLEFNAQHLVKAIRSYKGRGD